MSSGKLAGLYRFDMLPIKRIQCETSGVHLVLLWVIWWQQKNRLNGLVLFIHSVCHPIFLGSMTLESNIHEKSGVCSIPFLALRTNYLKTKPPNTWKGRFPWPADIVHH